MDLGRGDEFYGADALTMSGQQVRSAAKRILAEGGKRLDPKQYDRVEALIDGLGAEGEKEESYIARRVLLTENPVYRSDWREVITNTLTLLNSEQVESLLPL